MTKTIDTLVDDIKGVLGKSTAVLDEDVLAKYGSSVAMHVADALRERTGTRKPYTLYPSEVGKPCIRQTWYGVHTPHLAEPMPEHTLFKFLYGNVIEETVLFLAEAAGHTVEMRQAPAQFDVVGGWTIRGRIDAVIDGVLVDVKGVSSFGYKKFQEGLTDENDSFGYRAQLSTYTMALKHKGSQGFVAVDKQNGHVGWFPQPYMAMAKQLSLVVGAVNNARVEPPRKFKLEPMGKSGNLKLCTECSYCPFKATCWRDANHGEGLKAYAYAGGPVFLGTVVDEPRVPAIPMPDAGELDAAMSERSIPEAKIITPMPLRMPDETAKDIATRH